MNDLTFNDQIYLEEATQNVFCDCGECSSECDCGDSDCVMQA